MTTIFTAMARNADRSISPRHSNQDDRGYQKRRSTQNLHRHDPDDQDQYQHRDSHRNADRHTRSSIPRTYEDEGELQYPRRDSNRSSTVRTREDEDEAQFQQRNLIRDSDRKARSSIARNDDSEDDAHYLRRNSTRDTDRNQRSSVARTREDDDEAQHQRLGLHFDPDRPSGGKQQRPSKVHAWGDEDRHSGKPHRSSMVQRHEGEQQHELYDEQHSDVRRKSKSYEEREERDQPRRQRSSLPNEEYHSGNTRQSKSHRPSYVAEMDDEQPKGRRSLSSQRRAEDDDVDDRRHLASRSPQKRSTHSPIDRRPSNDPRPFVQKVEDDVASSDYSDCATEVQSDDGSWRPITAADLKSLRHPKKDASRSPQKSSRSNHGQSDRHQKFDDTPPKSVPHKRAERHSLDSQEMNVSLTPRSHSSPKSSLSHRKRIVLDCRYDQDEIGSLKWGFGDEGAYLKRFPQHLGAKFGLDQNDMLISINGKSVVRMLRRDIETYWLDAQEDDDFLTLILEGWR